jgi:hypothetical protein
VPVGLILPCNDVNCPTRVPFSVVTRAVRFSRFFLVYVIVIDRVNDPNKTQYAVTVISSPVLALTLKLYVLKKKRG